MCLTFFLGGFVCFGRLGEELDLALSRSSQGFWWSCFGARIIVFGFLLGCFWLDINFWFGFLF